MSEAVWNCHSGPLHVSSNVKLPFLTTRCQYQCEIAILDHYMSVTMWNCHSWPLDVSSNVKLPFLTTRCQYGGSVCQSMFVCQVWCSGIQGIYSWLTEGGQLAKVGLSAKFGVVVYKASILNWLGGPSAKVGSSAKFCVLVFKSSLLYSPGGPLAKVGSSPKFCVLVLK